MTGDTDIAPEKPPGESLQRLASVHVSIHDHFNLDGYPVARQTSKKRRPAAQDSGRRPDDARIRCRSAAIRGRRIGRSEFLADRSSSGGRARPLSGPSADIETA